MVTDRFKKLSKNYAQHFEEVLEIQGIKYGDLQKSILKTISSIRPNFRELRILDIGCGDGDSLKPFVDSGCVNLTGIDLSPKMVKQSKSNFGKKVKILKVDATNMNIFKKGDFEIIITSTSIHNIPKKDRKKFWKEVVRLNPEILVLAEKIADPDPIKHNRSYRQEVDALIKIYRDKYKLNKIADEWVKHYEYDEKEKMTLNEIRNHLSKLYRMSVVFEEGVNKIVLAINNEFPTKPKRNIYNHNIL